MKQIIPIYFSFLYCAFHQIIEQIILHKRAILAKAGKKVAMVEPHSSFIIYLFKGLNLFIIIFKGTY